MSPLQDMQVDSAATLDSIAARAVERARAAGADQAEACVDSARAFTVSVLGGAIENLKQSVTHGLGLRVIVGGAIGFVSTNDFRGGALDDLARRAVALARFSTPDEANHFPGPQPAGDGDDALRLYDPEVVELSTEFKIDLALELERIALAHDPRIRRTDGASVSSRSARRVLVNSAGLRCAHQGTSVSMGVAPLADDRDGKQQSGYYSVAKRWRRELPGAEEVALEAARRAVARIGARTVPAACVPVVMHPDIGAAWLSEMHEAFSGEEVIKQASWLTGRLGQTIAAPAVRIVDDGRMVAGIGSTPHDGEGIATRRNVLVDGGVCAMFEYDVYHARRAGTESTGSAVRSYSSLPGIGYHNLYLEAGSETPEAILKRVDRGFYMDDQGSFGFNSTTGDYSYQAQGFWIENGQKTFPVDGVTVASNSLEMLRNIVGVGNDLKFEHSVACPTLLIAEMTLSGGGG